MHPPLKINKPDRRGAGVEECGWAGGSDILCTLEKLENQIPTYYPRKN